MEGRPYSAVWWWAGHTVQCGGWQAIQCSAVVDRPYSAVSWLAGHTVQYGGGQAIQCSVVVGRSYSAVVGRPYSAVQWWACHTVQCSGDDGRWKWRWQFTGDSANSSCPSCLPHRISSSTAWLPLLFVSLNPVSLYPSLRILHFCITSSGIAYVSTSASRITVSLTPYLTLLYPFIRYRFCQYLRIPYLELRYLSLLYKSIQTLFICDQLLLMKCLWVCVCAIVPQSPCQSLPII